MMVIDSGVLIDLLRGKEASLAWWPSVDDPIASEITRFEVLQGMRASERRATQRLLDSLTWRAFDREISLVAGSLGREYRRSHQGIDLPDFCVAATAQVLDAALATTNVRHFPMFPELRPPY